MSSGNSPAGAFEEHLAREIVQSERLRMGGAERESRRAFVCVMFMDIRNFTPTVENKSPEEIVA
jgi:class 3 adenylate cyclase